jgi:hypothetical protein
VSSGVPSAERKVEGMDVWRVVMMAVRWVGLLAVKMVERKAGQKVEQMAHSTAVQ